MSGMSIADRLTAVFDHLSIKQAPVAACMSADWSCLVGPLSSRVANLAVVAPHLNQGVPSEAGSFDKPVAVIAGDEGWHAKAYRLFVDKFLELDRDEALLAIADMFRKKITMPAMNMREAGREAGDAFKRFEVIAQRSGVYTSLDYIEIMESLIDAWNIAHLDHLSPEAERAQDFICTLPARYRKAMERRGSSGPNEDIIAFAWNI